MGTFIVFHQTIVELFKLTGVKSRRYWEALAYIVYGPTLSKKGKKQKKYWWHDVASGSPSTIDPFFQGKGGDDKDRPYTTPQERLIQGFLLRGVGDSPVTDISDSDIRNVIQVIRFAELNQGDKGLARISELLDELIRTAPHSSTFLIQQVSHIKQEHPRSRVTELLDEWIATLSADASSDNVKPAALAIWRAELNQRYFQAILRAERELANALKSAEFQYVSHLSWFSSGTALIEALLVPVVLWSISNSTNSSGYETSLKIHDYLIAFILSFGVLATAPRGTKSLLDAVIGLGNRMKG